MPELILKTRMIPVPSMYTMFQPKQSGCTCQAWRKA